MHTIILFAKAPRAGEVKLRLASSGGLDLDDVARLADAFLRDTVRNCRRAAPARLVFSFAPPDGREYFRGLDRNADLVPQPDAPFGERVAAAFVAAFDSGATRVVILGADTPHLAPSRIDAAFEALATHDGVIGPAEDGGYDLLGLRRRCDALFDGIEWSSPRVLSQTLERAAAAGLAIARLPESFDVDTIADLERLRELIAREPDLCPATARIVAAASGR